ncbi:hypothetical protein DQ04_17491010, partial [Trypanosoma grayi]|uniref:hypothetical protein n=1 Tax=Trypanosoma grayi TaxID=71804 RepID=UPI0004F41C4B
MKDRKQRRFIKSQRHGSPSRPRSGTSPHIKSRFLYILCFAIALLDSTALSFASMPANENHIDIIGEITGQQRSPLVVVVGGGLAGQSAAIEAANCGAQVILLEKE